MKLQLPLLSICLIFIFATAGHSQSAPGYIGKKTTLGIGLGVVAALNGPDRKNRGDYSRDPELWDKFSIDNLVSLELSHTITRHGSVSFLFNKTATGVNNSFLGQIKLEDGTVLPELYNFRGFLRADVSSYGFLHNAFKAKKGYLAPLGRSFNIGIKFNQIKASNTPNNNENQIPNLEDINVEQKFGYTSFVLGWSQTIIIKDLIYIKPRVLFAISTKTASAESNGYYSDDDLQANFESDFLARMLHHDAFQFDISAGILF